MSKSGIKDRLGRTIDYLRLSVTDKCNLNCEYCRHSETAGAQILTFEEIERIVNLFAKCGIRKIRLTGGEPLVREDILEIIGICRKPKEVKDVALTTNGILLKGMAAKLKAAGLDRVNISIDSLSAGKYKRIARADSLGHALEGVDAAMDAGLAPVKINTVLMHGINDDEIDDLIKLAENRDVQVRFIEYMPMGKHHEGRYISLSEIISERPYLKKASESAGVETLYRIDGYKGLVGFITPVSRPFCENCNRIRITPDARIRHCLGNNMEADLRGILKENDETAEKLIRETIAKKPERGFCGGFETNRGMGSIGG